MATTRGTLDALKEKMVQEIKVKQAMLDVVSQLEPGKLYYIRFNKGRALLGYVPVRGKPVSLRERWQDSIRFRAVADEGGENNGDHRPGHVIDLYVGSLLGGTTVEEVDPEMLPQFLGWAWTSPELDRMIKDGSVTGRPIRVSYLDRGQRRPVL